MGLLAQRLENQSATKSFFQYLIPTFLGMMLMSVNIVIDGIFVGNGVGSVALASVNIAVPVFSIIISITLLIGIGGATLYSMAMGERDRHKAQAIFTTAAILVTIVTTVMTIICYWQVERLAKLLGATPETLPMAVDYMKILLIFSLVIAWETSLSIFVRNDGNPQLAMAGLIVSAIANIALNYWMIFILKMGVKGAAYATIIATAIGLFVLLIHFFKKGSGLRLIKTKLTRTTIGKISAVGFPSFLSEVGIGVFVVGYNIAMAYYIGTNGLAAFSIINYLHTFMFLAFIGIGSSIQPMISYYFGANKGSLIKDTIRVSEISAFVFGVAFIVIGYIGANFFVSIFGVESEDIVKMSVLGIKLFFLGYLFMGINFIYMTYFQAIGAVKASTMITVLRSFIFPIIMLLILPVKFGALGIWLSLPVAELLMACILFLTVRKKVYLQKDLQRQVHSL